MRCPKHSSRKEERSFKLKLIPSLVHQLNSNSPDDFYECATGSFVLFFEMLCGLWASRATATLSAARLCLPSSVLTPLVLSDHAGVRHDFDHFCFHRSPFWSMQGLLLRFFSALGGAERSAPPASRPLCWFCGRAEESPKRVPLSPVWVRFSNMFVIKLMFASVKSVQCSKQMCTNTVNLNLNSNFCPQFCLHSTHRTFWSSCPCCRRKKKKSELILLPGN